MDFVKRKEEGSVEKVFVTGCLSERYKPDLEKEIPNVDQYFGTTELPKLLKSDKDILMAAVKQDGYIFFYAPAEVHDNEEILLEAVRQNGMILQHILDKDFNNEFIGLGSYRSNKKIVTAAIEQNWNAYKYAPDYLKQS